jgi:hypothetical protein
MTAIQLNAEIYEALSIIAKDESLLRKAAKALKKLASQKSDETLMNENDFFVRIDEAKKQIKSGKCKKMLQNENLTFPVTTLVLMCFNLLFCVFIWCRRS